MMTQLRYSDWSPIYTFHIRSKVSPSFVRSNALIRKGAAQHNFRWMLLHTVT